MDIFLDMLNMLKYILISLLLSFKLSAQTYIGNNNLSLCFLNERVEKLGTGEFIWGFKTVIGEESLLKLRMGFQLSNGKWSAIIFLPVLNLNLKTMLYNTPINAEARYRSFFLFVGGVEIYTNKPLFYGSILIPFNYGRL